MVDPKSERRRAKHERKLTRRERRAREAEARNLRSATRQIGIVGLIKLTLDGRQLRKALPVSDNCPRCLKRRKRVA
jgi:hypothetical protein